MGSFRVLDSAGNTKTIQGPVNLATGVMGNLGVSHLNGGSGATGSTFWRGDGTWQPIGGQGADSVSIVKSAAVATYNLSTLGTLDWLFPDGNTMLPRQIAQGALHEKGVGGWLSQGFQWIEGGYAPTMFTQNITPQITTTAGDDAASAIASAAIGGQGLYTAAGAAYGFRLTVPAGSGTRTLAVYHERYACNCTVTAKLVGQTITTQTLTTTDGAAATASTAIFTVTFTAPVGGSLSFSLVQNGTFGTSSPNIKFGFAYLT